MARPLRHMKRPYQIFEVTIRCVQERFLLRPSEQLNIIILGVIGRALELYPDIRIYVFKFGSVLTGWHIERKARKVPISRCSPRPAVAVRRPLGVVWW